MEFLEIIAKKKPNMETNTYRVNPNLIESIEITQDDNKYIIQVNTINSSYLVDPVENIQVVKQYFSRELETINNIKEG